MKTYRLLENTPIHSLFLTDSPKKHNGSIKNTTVLYTFKEIERTEVNTIIFEKQLEFTRDYAFIHYICNDNDYVMIIQPCFLKNI